MAATLAKAVVLIREAEEAGVLLRLAGSLAVEIYSPLGDRPVAPGDIDLVAIGPQRRQVQGFLKDRGWLLRGGLLLVAEARDVFYNDSDGASLDVYYDMIDGNHPIRISESRLKGSFPAIPLGELMLSKLQRRSLRAADVWDCCSLLSVGAMNDEGASRVLARDWGLFQTVRRNLNLLRETCGGQRAEIELVLRKMNDQPKTYIWRLRSLVGDRWKSWHEVYQPKRRSK